jgi:branched-chain amino acid transport system permease protein
VLDFPQFLAQFLSGVSYASTLFLVSSGLSVIYGVTRIVNFAHGSFFMVGAYVACSLTARLPATPLGFWTAMLLSSIAVGLAGIVMELVVLRRIYRAPELFQILATFGVILIVQNLVQLIWGADEIFASRAPGLRGVVEIAGQAIPQYDLALIAIGPLVLVLIWLLLHKTRWGILVRAATQDREMTASLGINQSLLFTSVVFVGCFLAGFAGALQIPKDTANLQMDLNIITEAFVVVVIGGLGSVLGAFLAALLIGQTHAFGILAFPSGTLVMTFLLMAVVLVVRPFGFLGRAEKPQRIAAIAVEPLRESDDRRRHLLAAALLVILLALPTVVNEYARIIVTEIFILALFAASLHLMMSIGGMISFGHAAYFGLGAYAAAWFTTRLGLAMMPAIVVGIVAAGMAGAVIGWFSTRLFGVYLAMLTLAFAQILWSVAVQWVSLTGGDNGILGVRASEWLLSSMAYYYFALFVCLAALWLLRRLVFAPFGYTLRAGRDSPLRADASGIPVRRQQLTAFIVSGLFAGLAGGLIAFQRGRVFPNDLGIGTSIDSLVMVLLGGVQTLTGPVVGAASYHLLRTELLRHFAEYWRLILGLIVVLLVVLFPTGIVGAAKQLVAARFPSRRTA